MSAEWTGWLARWRDAGLIDADTESRIQAYERQHAGSARLRWPVLVAIGFGAVMLGGGVLLFVAAHWDALSPSQRFALVLLLVGGFHLAGAFFNARFPGMSSAFHAVGTVALGAGIALAGQIFNLEEHWPSGVMWWAAGAAIGWMLLRQLPQLVLLAVLAPAWLTSEWMVLVRDPGSAYSFRVVASGIFLLALAYFTAPGSAHTTDRRRALMWLGGVALLPAAAALAAAATSRSGLDSSLPSGVSTALVTIGWLVALGAPLALAFVLRRMEAWPNAVSVAWVLVLLFLERGIGVVPLYLWWAAGAIALVAWGVRDGRSERVNVGAVLFAATVLTFYFSQVMDKLGRSASLVGLGLLFLAGGWALERVRRRLVMTARGAA